MAGTGLVWPLKFEWLQRSTVQTTPELEQMLHRGAVVAIGVSGGKDYRPGVESGEPYLRSDAKTRSSGAHSQGAGAA
jgi:hypothetical protein